MARPVKSLEYKFKDFPWLSDMAGFNMPTDVYYGTVLIGVISSRPEGYVIDAVMAPTKPQIIAKTPHNMFKTKNDAAKIVHKMWMRFRKMARLFNDK